MTNRETFKSLSAVNVSSSLCQTSSTVEPSHLLFTLLHLFRAAMITWGLSQDASHSSDSPVSIIAMKTKQFETCFLASAGQPPRRRLSRRRPTCVSCAWTRPEEDVLNYLAPLYSWNTRQLTLTTTLQERKSRHRLVYLWEGRWSNFRLTTPCFLRKKENKEAKEGAGRRPSTDVMPPGDREATWLKDWWQTGSLTHEQCVRLSVERLTCPLVYHVLPLQVTEVWNLHIAAALNPRGASEPNKEATTQTEECDTEMD